VAPGPVSSRSSAPARTGQYTAAERSIYILARLSPRYPTVEVRVADVCLDTGTGLTR